MKCHTPYYDCPPGYLEAIPFSCGKCPACKSRRTQQWIQRIQHEFAVSTSAYFITLTYDTDHVPISRNGFMTLGRISKRKRDKGKYVYSDWQDFMRRLRKSQSTKIRYYACGEYGEQRRRPHWHAILFNVESPHLIIQAWKVDGVQIGKVDIDADVNNRNIAYVASYVNKGGVVPEHANDDRLPEKSFMSKGIGRDYATNPRIRNYHQADYLNRNYLAEGDKKVPMPKYYRQLIFTERMQAEQRRFINEQQMQDELDKRESFAYRYRHRDDVDMDTYERLKYEEILADYRRFYSTQKERNYD